MTEKNCKDLEKALESKDTNLIIKTIGSFKSKYRIRIGKKFKEIIGKDLLSEIKRFFNGDLYDFIKALFTDPIEYDAECIHLAIKDQDSLLEIILTRPNSIIKQIMQKYFDIYKANLEETINSSVLGDFKKLISTLLKCGRNEGDTLSSEEIEEKANELVEADYDDWNLNENSPFCLFLTKYTRNEMVAIAKIYNKKANKNIEQKVQDVFSGDIKRFLQNALYCIISPSEYLATRINDAMSGVSVNIRLLMRILATRSNLDLYKIIKYYQLLYKKDLKDTLSTLIKDDIGKLMIEIINNNQ